MANLTTTADAEVLKRARLRATEQGASVNAVVRDYLEQYGGDRSAQEQALAKLFELSGRSRARRGRRTWTRDELHERERNSSIQAFDSPCSTRAVRRSTAARENTRARARRC